MSLDTIINGLLAYVCLLIVLTFHEFAHAWVAAKCGDDTARLQGRVSLNPLVHMDLIGTVVLPLVMVFLTYADSGLARFIIGWGKPVPVNPSNFRRRRLDDALVSLAGPGMNLLLAAVILILARVFAEVHLEKMVEPAMTMAYISLLLCFFNLLPIPPLDGSHLLKNLGMSEETHLRLSRFGIILVIVALQFPFVLGVLRFATRLTFFTFARLVGLG
jgi:Zn-dependent protease